MLVGRDRELAAIARLLERARAGHAGRLLIEGEPGMGKTALLSHALDRAQGMTIVRATGVETEAELEFSGLLELCRPLLRVLDGLPGPHAAALRGSLGLTEGRRGDRFGIGAAMLTLLAQAAEDAPLLVLLDDVQWVDRASTEALCFATRRLEADGVAVLAAARTGGAALLEAAGFDVLPLGALDADAAATLVARSSTVVASAVAEQLVELTGGNALALAEIGRALTDAQLSGGEELPDPLPVGPIVEQAYARRLDTLSPVTQEALVVMAVAGEDAEALSRALASRETSIEALEEAEDAGLVSVVDGNPSFVHPLMRSAVHGAARPSQRRAAHRAVADALVETGRAERRAWHLAAAAVGPDAEAADALAAAAVVARNRTGYGAATRAFERAARLTPDPALRRERLSAAAEAAFEAGDRERAIALAEEALAECDDPRTRAQLLRLLGRVELQTGPQGHARELLVTAAETAADVDRDLAATTTSLAVFSCHFGGRIAESVELAQRARSLAPSDGGVADEHADYVLGRSLLLAGEYEEGRVLLEPLVERWLALADPPRVTLARTATALIVLERADEASAVASQVERVARDEGPMALVYGLSLVAELSVRAGRWRRATRAAEEGLALARELGQDNVAAHLLAALVRVAAARGDRSACVEGAAAALAVLDANEMTLPASQVRCSLGLLELGLDRLDEAVIALEPVAAATAAMGLADPDVCPVPDLVEGLVRLGRHDDAAAQLEAWSSSTPQEAPWLLARRARCDGLLAPEDAFEARFAASLEHDTGADAFATARTRLCFGERLRRAGRRVDARRELRAALEPLERLEAGPWVERARRELRATGEKIGRRRAERGDELTAQELQIALQVAEGKQNKEVAAALFLSPKTVEFHLGRIYRKLGISSRAELVRRFAAELAVSG